MADDDAFARWWVSRRGRPPTPDEAEEFRQAREIWDEIWQGRDLPASREQAEDDAAEYQRGWRDCAAFVLQNVSPLPEVVFRDWAHGHLGDDLQPVIRALRNEDDTAFLVARLEDDAPFASLDAVHHRICAIATTPDEDETMRADYQSAEAFAALLSALPRWVALLSQLRRFGGVPLQSRDLGARALTEPDDIHRLEDHDDEEEER